MARFDQLIVKTKQEREGKYCPFFLFYIIIIYYFAREI